MSLIPSESHSFPDHFTSTVVPSRRPKKAKPEPVLAVIPIVFYAFTPTLPDLEC